jgi:hypothetical protein
MKEDFVSDDDFNTCGYVVNLSNPVPSVYVESGSGCYWNTGILMETTNYLKITNIDNYPW